jgi:hypothetical protein
MGRDIVMVIQPGHEMLDNAVAGREERRNTIALHPFYKSATGKDAEIAQEWSLASNGNEVWQVRLAAFGWRPSVGDVEASAQSIGCSGDLSKKSMIR